MHKFFILWLTILLFSSGALPAMAAGNFEIDQIKALKIQPNPGKALIYLYRAGSNLDNYKLFFDDNKVPSLYAKSFIVIETEPGRHRIESKSPGASMGRLGVGSHEIYSFEADQIYFIENVISIDPRSYVYGVPISEFWKRKESHWLKIRDNLSFLDFIGNGTPQEMLLAETSPLQTTTIPATAVSPTPTKPTPAAPAQVIASTPTPPTIKKTVTAPPTASVAPPVALPPPRKSLQNLTGIAVIIGNRNYSKNNRDLPDVDYALNDAQAMYDYVRTTLGYREGNIIYLKDATQAQLLSIFGIPGDPEGKLFNWVRPKQSDVFVYYSGHGVPGAKDGRSYLLPVDADPTTVQINGYLLETLYANLAAIPAKSVTVVLDACFSGGSAGGAVFQKASSITLRTIDTPALLPKGVIFSATGKNEVASWDQDAKLGLFTRAYLEGLKGAADAQGFGDGDGNVSLAELKGFLEEEVAYAARRNYGRKQTPQVFGPG